MTHPIKLTDEVLQDILQRLYDGSDCYVEAEMRLAAIRTLRDRARAVCDSVDHGDYVRGLSIDRLREVLP